MTYKGHEYLFGNIEWLRADRQPCPVCGHPTGDCLGSDPSPIHLFGQTKETAEKDLVKVEKDVTKEIYIGPSLHTTIVVARAGSYIPRKKAEELGII